MTDDPNHDADDDDEGRDPSQSVIFEHEDGGDIIAEQLTPTDEGTIVEQLRRVEKTGAD